MQLAPAYLRKPHGWEVHAGADTGTFMSGVIAFLEPVTYDLYVVEEFPNYRYVGDGTPELTGMTVSEWVRGFALRLRYWTKESKNSAWADANTTFKTEIGHGFRYRMNRKSLELRTEITREYMRNGRIHLAPWLTVLPFEFQEAKFPDNPTPGAGRYQRIKQKDHTLDCVEHICSRRPHPSFTLGKTTKGTMFDALLKQYGQPMPAQYSDPHLGPN